MLQHLAVLGLLGLAYAEMSIAADEFIGSDTPQALPAPLESALGRLETFRLQEHVAWLADARREGRGLATHGLEVSAEYIVDHLKAVGLVPLLRGSADPPRAAFFQSLQMREVRNVGGDITFTSEGVPARAAIAGVSAVLPGIVPQTIQGKAIFAGYGIREPAMGHDDFRGLDVRGHIVVFRSGVPPGPEWQTPTMLERYALPRPQDRYDARLDILAELGATAAIAIEPGLSERLKAGNEPLQKSYFLPAEDGPRAWGVPLVRVAPEVFAGIPEPDALPAGSKVSIRATGRVFAATSRNVFAVLKGSDPERRKHAVIIGAHMDGVGMQGGILHPAANDNASGVAAVLEIARCVAMGPVRPRRSIVFAFWTGEEAGQFGSSHYVRHPLWPLERTTAYLNLDTIAHPWSKVEIDRLILARTPAGASELLVRATPANFTELGLPDSASELADGLSTAALGVGMLVHVDLTDGRNGGSDYRSFARLGLPFIRFFGTFFPGYHEPQDTPDQVDAEQVRRMARLALATAWTLADR